MQAKNREISPLGREEDEMLINARSRCHKYRIIDE